MEQEMSALYFWIGFFAVAISTVGTLVGGILVKNNWGYWNRSPSAKSDSEAVIAECPVTITAPNSPGSTNVAIGNANNVTVNQTDPSGLGTLNDKLDAVNRKLDMAISTFELTKEMPRLEKEYDLGFVLIAFPGTIDATRVRPHSDRIQADWDRCEVYEDAEGLVFAKVPRFQIKGSPTSGAIVANSFNIGIPPTPGIPFGPFTIAEVVTQSELLTQTSSVNCAVIGFKTEKVPPRK
jgi:hypothetical protein